MASIKEKEQPQTNAPPPAIKEKLAFPSLETFTELKHSERLEAIYAVLLHLLRK